MTTSAADKLLAAAEGVRRTGEGRYMLRCLAHKDRSASLSMRVLDDGRVLLHCFAGCSVDEIVRAAGLELQDLFPPRSPDGEHSRHKAQKPFVARDAVRAFRRELTVAWVILADVAAGRNISELDRQRAGIARDRCVALISEIDD